CVKAPLYWYFDVW
nr:immunoglobulin heavy chain junction region [Mus musculus]MBK4186515.1 immunoglobulin heavy chain junction region [Mus musculus]